MKKKIISREDATRKWPEKQDWADLIAKQMCFSIYGEEVSAPPGDIAEELRDAYKRGCSKAKGEVERLKRIMMAHGVEACLHPNGIQRRRDGSWCPICGEIRYGEYI